MKPGQFRSYRLDANGPQNATYPVISRALRG